MGNTIVAAKPTLPLDSRVKDVPQHQEEEAQQEESGAGDSSDVAMDHNQLQGDSDEPDSGSETGKAPSPPVPPTQTPQIPTSSAAAFLHPRSPPLPAPKAAINPPAAEQIPRTQLKQEPQSQRDLLQRPVPLPNPGYKSTRRPFTPESSPEQDFPTSTEMMSQILPQEEEKERQRPKPRFLSVREREDLKKAAIPNQK